MYLSHTRLAVIRAVASAFLRFRQAEPCHLHRALSRLLLCFRHTIQTTDPPRRMQYVNLGKSGLKVSLNDNHIPPPHRGRSSTDIPMITGIKAHPRLPVIRFHSTMDDF